MRIKLLLCLLVFSMSQAASSSTLFTPEVPDEIKLYIVGRDVKTYYDFISLISRDPSENIKSKYKKKLNANVLYNDPSRGEVFGSAKIRITGDWKDHIDTERNIASVSVQLKNEHIGNIIKFRLLLPHTKNGDNEIFWSLLMEELGFPVPYRKIVKVNLNDQITFDAIFDESTEKEFLERFGYRESPVIESDERQPWANRVWMHMPDYCLGRGEHGQCAPEKGEPNYFSYKVDNASFLKNEISNNIALEAFNNLDIFHSRNRHSTDNMKRFDHANYKMAYHGMLETNRKWIYDPMYGIHIPIYFDGNIDYARCVLPKSLHLPEWKKIAIERIKEKLFLRNGKMFTQNMLCAANDILHKKAYIQPEKVNLKRQARDLNLNTLVPLPSHPNIFPNIIWRATDNTVELCKEFSRKSDDLRNCRTLSREEASKYIAGNGKPYKYDRYEVFPVVLPNERRQESTIKIFYSPTSRHISIPKKNIYYISFKNFSEELHVTLEDPATSKVVFFNSSFEDSAKINISSKERTGYDLESIRYNERLLTSCATFIDSKLSGLSIGVKNGLCEDSLNFVRSQGYIDNIAISNAASDALDIDFSNLDIKQIVINGAGNDCIDLSAGNYNISTVKTNGCSDKSISAGERARVSVKAVFMSNSNLGLVSKDSSKLHVRRIAIASNVSSCAESYRKKQEYSGAETTIGKQPACKGFTYDKGSKITVKDSMCHYFSTVDNAEACINNKGVTLSYFKAARNYIWSMESSEGILPSGQEKCDKNKKCHIHFQLKKTPQKLIINKIKEKSKIASKIIYPKVFSSAK